MCGIAGMVLRDRRGTVDPRMLDRMTDVLVHRGPDDRGTQIVGNVGLGNRRLAIIDIAGGHQPMSSPDGDLWITYNGELYNYVELRDDLVAQGYPLRTDHSDTEVILALYAIHGVEMFERMNGMFAFAIYDRRQRRLLLARDRFGEKPLYVYEDGERLLFASEIKSFLEAGVVARPDRDALDEYFTFQYCLGERTLFEGVRKLRPASYLLLDDTGRELERKEYWSLHFEEDRESSQDDFMGELRGLLDDAVRIRLRSDVPVGAYLSGGLDSSLVAALSAKELGPGLPVFTGWFAEGADFDERGYAQSVASATRAEHHLVECTADDFARSLRDIVWHMDEPAAGPGVFPQLVVSRAARERVTVVLGGQGGDELFGGYARYLMLYLEESIKGSIFETQDPARHIVTLDRVLPHLAMLQRYVPALQSFWSGNLFGPVEERYFALVARAPRLHDLLGADFLGDRDERRLFGAFEREFSELPSTKPLFNRMTAYDARTMLQSLLHVEDRMSMAVSLESRLPLLDHRIAELMFRMPAAYKYRDGMSKAALRSAAEGLVPDVVRNRKDKMGFPVPFVDWARGPLREFVRDILLGEAARLRGIYRPEGIERLLEAEQPFGRELWGLICLETWFQTFVD
jgi:asparagine synthase (glutamine-hydrolysing)